MSRFSVTVSADIAQSAQTTIEALLRITQAYDELPQLCVSLQQAQRLWGLDPTVCEAVLATLTDVGFLVLSGNRYRRASR
jgi:hypothetical protein